MRLTIDKPVIKGQHTTNNKIILDIAEYSGDCVFFDLANYLKVIVGDMARIEEVHAGILVIEFDLKHAEKIKELLSHNLTFISQFVSQYPFLRVKESYTGREPPFSTVLLLEHVALTDPKEFFALIQRIVNTVAPHGIWYLVTRDDIALRRKLKPFLKEHGALALDPKKLASFFELFMKTYRATGGTPLEEDLLIMESDGLHMGFQPSGTISVQGKKLGTVGKMTIKKELS